MVDQWDTLLKLLFKEKTQDLIRWLLPGARYRRSVPAHLPSRKIDADGLYEITVRGKRCLLHVEFQSYRDRSMAKRLWEYNVRATLQYKCPVRSFVIYLRKERSGAKSPYIWTFPDGQEVHRFQFTAIQLWEEKAETLKQLGLVGLLPLVPLTHNGKRPEEVEEVITIIQATGGESASELLSLTYLIASLVFTKEGEQEWLDRRFSMLHDILRDSWAYKKIKQEGLLEGREEGRQQGLQEERLTLLEIVQARFPALEQQAKKKADATNDLATLRHLIVQVSLAQTEEAAKQVLHIKKGKKKISSQ